MPRILELWRWIQEDQKFIVSLNYIAGLKLAYVTWDLFSKKLKSTEKKKRKEKENICKKYMGRNRCLDYVIFGFMKTQKESLFLYMKVLQSI